MKEDIDKILEYLKSLEDEWAWGYYLERDTWGDPYFKSDKVISEIKELINYSEKYETIV